MNRAETFGASTRSLSDLTGGPTVRRRCGSATLARAAARIGASHADNQARRHFTNS